MIRVDAHEVTALGRDLDRAAETVGPKVDMAVRRTAFAMEGTMKVLAAVDTGTMRSSVSTDIDGSFNTGTIEAEIGPTVDYAVFVEGGTRHMAPQPFVAPGFDMHIDPFTRAMGSIGAEIL